MRTRRRDRRSAARRAVELVSLWLVIATCVVWVSSYWVNAGIGVGSTSKAKIEISTVPGGLMVVYDGTRTDNITYDDSTGWMMLGEGVYLLVVEKVTGKPVWWPWREWPAAWCGPYTFVPLWMVVVASAVVLLSVQIYARQRGCPMCGYSREGLAAGSGCPECGASGEEIASVRSAGIRRRFRAWRGSSRP